MMSSFAEVIVNIIIVLVMLGVLVSIHEAGHLAAAKIFKVYCFEYSIGMGPKIFSKKRKNGETTFSLRAFPLGGYVSMYSGEEEEDPENEITDLPPKERSLNAIKTWKKCIILVAGVTLNFALGLVLIYIGDAAFPIYYYGRSGISESDTMLTADLDTSFNDDSLAYIDAHKPVASEYEAKDYVISVYSYNLDGGSISILSDSVLVYNVHDQVIEGGEYFVACYVPSSLVDDHDLGGSIYLFPSKEEPIPASYANLGLKRLPILYKDDGSLSRLDLSGYSDGVYVGFSLITIPDQVKKDAELWMDNRVDLPIKLTVNNGVLTGDAVKILRIREWNSFTESWVQWGKDVPSACGAVVQGFASLFTPGGWRNISGIIGITAAMPQIRASGGGRLVFFYAGMISINLAFFNLLPVPGLDGWALLVTGIEKVSKKKVPPKARTIATMIGFGLLIVLVLFVTIKDIVALF